MKTRKTYYTLTILGLLWILPINRYYLGQRAFLRTITVNWFYFGAVADVINMKFNYEKTMAKRGTVRIER